jgi:signal peptidase II
MAARSARWLWLTFAVVAADRASKYGVEQLTSQGYRRTLIPHFADLVHSVNAGIAFGLFSGSDFKWISFLLVTASTVVILLLVWLLAAGIAGGTGSQAGIALIAGGAAGNLLDRLLYGGVTDFLELYAGSFRWPAFNVADAAITIGAVLIILDLFSGEKDARRAHA